ncbi:MAG: PD40 domain-containing protein [Planctomycetes bacterium]|nr:PD40 domain-containing protein [Planctomycetota bacterium]
MRTLLLISVVVPWLSAAEVATERVSVGSSGDQGNNAALEANPRGDGQVVAMTDSSSNFPPNVPSNAHLNTDVFVRDRIHGTLTGLQVAYDSSVSRRGQLRFTADGSILFYTMGDMQTSVWAYRMSDGTNTRISAASSNQESLLGISATGRYVLTRVYYGGTTDNRVITVIDRTITGSRDPIEVPAGEALNGTAAVSADGRIVAYSSYAISRSVTSIVSYVHIYDRTTHQTTTIDTTAPEVAMSDDGRWVAYTDLRAPTSHVVLRDRTAGSDRLVSATGAGAPGNGASGQPSVSADGSAIAYVSAASDLVVGDSNGHADVFRFDRAAGVTHLMSISNAGVAANADSSLPELNADGTVVVYVSDATNLVSGDTNGFADAFASTAPISAAPVTTTTGAGTGSSTTGTSTTGSSDTGSTGTTATSSPTSSGNTRGCGLGGVGAAAAAVLTLSMMRRRER